MTVQIEHELIGGPVDGAVVDVEIFNRECPPILFWQGEELYHKPGKEHKYWYIKPLDIPSDSL